MRQSCSSLGSLSYNRWRRNYGEGVREHAPLCNSQPSLFLFGWNEFERSKLVEQDLYTEKHSKERTTSENTLAYPVKLQHANDYVLPASDSFKRRKPHALCHTTKTFVSDDEAPANAGNSVWRKTFSATASAISTLPRRSSTDRRPKSSESNDFSPKIDLTARQQVKVPLISRRASGSWPGLTSRTRYIYAYPEELPMWIRHHEAKRHQLNGSQPKYPACPSGEQLHHFHNSVSEDKQQEPLEALSPEHHIHQSMVAELKARFQTMNKDTNQAPDKSPDKMLKSSSLPSAELPPAPPVHRKSLMNEMPPSNNSLKEIQRILQSATVKIENLLTVESGERRANSPTSLLSTKPYALKTPEESKTHQHSQRTQLAPDSSLAASEEATSWQKQPVHWSENSYATVTSSSPNADTRPTKASSNQTESDLLELVHRKVAKGMLLEWPELFLLKNSHCRWVVGREREFRRLASKPKYERVWRQISTELTSSYLQYQEILERVRVVDDLYTDLAHSIMKAESFWYGARICTDYPLRTRWYRSSIYLYKQLLDKARNCLPPNDRSLLTIIDKLSMIMLESCQADLVTVQLCRSAVAAAEEALDVKINLKIERKLMKIKSNLIKIESYILR